MRILIAGGTRFVGRHLTEAALAAGHDVTLLHRGRTGAGLFPAATHLLTDRDGDLSALAGRAWDATIDVSGYLPAQVHGLADALDERGGHYVYISSVSAYAVPLAPGFAEDAPLRDDDSYGGRKAACERVALERFGAGTLIVRPTYVVGPHDPLCRFTFWVERIARGGEVLAPGEPAAPIQLIDARDLAAWTLRMTARAAGGVFHAAAPAPPFSFGELLDATAAAVGPPGTRLTWVHPDFLGERGIDQENLPLWPAFDPEAPTNAADPAAAFAAGLAPRPLRQTIRDTYEHALHHPLPVLAPRLTAQREAHLLAEWRER